MKSIFQRSAHFFSLLFIGFSITANAQNNMGVGTTAPDASSVLDISSNSKGLLIPRLDNTQEGAVASPANGLLLYNTTQNRLKFYNGGWKPVSPWSLNGVNASFTGGNVETTGNFLLNNTSPTIYLQDTDHKSGMIHQNANLMHFLSGSGNNSTTWAINVSEWPLTLNMNNDAATFGGPAYFMEGNVGIGTTTPGYKLTIAGGEAIGLDNTATLYAKNSGGAYEVFCHPRWSDNIMYMNYGSGGFNIRNNAGVSTMFMTNGGNVGIGTSTPLTSLSITPNADGSKITLFDGGGATNHFGFGVNSGQLNYHVWNTSASHVFYARAVWPRPAWPRLPGRWLTITMQRWTMPDSRSRSSATRPETSTCRCCNERCPTWWPTHPATRTAERRSASQSTP